MNNISSYHEHSTKESEIKELKLNSSFWNAVLLSP